MILTYIYFVGSMYYRLSRTGDISPAVMGNPEIKFAALGFLYVYNFILIVINTIHIDKERTVKYFPKITLIK